MVFAKLIFTILSFTSTTYKYQVTVVEISPPVINTKNNIRITIAPELGGGNRDPPSPPPSFVWPKWLPPLPDNTEDYDGDGA